MEWLLYHNGLRHERVKVDKNPNSLLTNKHRLKLKKITVI